MNANDANRPRPTMNSHLISRMIIVRTPVQLFVSSSLDYESSTEKRTHRLLFPRRRIRTSPETTVPRRSVTTILRQRNRLSQLLKHRRNSSAIRLYFQATHYSAFHLIHSTMCVAVDPVQHRRAKPILLSLCVHIVSDSDFSTPIQRRPRNLIFFRLWLAESRPRIFASLNASSNVVSIDHDCDFSCQHARTLHHDSRSQASPSGLKLLSSRFNITSLENSASTIR